MFGVVVHHFTNGKIVVVIKNSGPGFTVVESQF